MKEVIFTVEGMKCGNCSGKIEKALSEISAIKSLSVSLEDKTVETAFDKSELKASVIKGEIESLGFKVLGMKSK